MVERPAEIAPSATVRRLVLALRVGLIAAAALATAAAFAIARDPGAGPRTPGFVCSMHPQVKAFKAETCPICGMQLAPRVRAEGPDARARPRLIFASPSEADEHDRRHAPIEWVTSRTLGPDVEAASWVESPTIAAAVLYPQEAASLQGEEVEYRFDRGDDSGAATVRVTMTGSAPWDSSTVLARFQAAPGALPSVDTLGRISARVRPRPAMVVNRDAIVDAHDGPSVFLVSDDLKRFTKRRVRAGRSFADGTIEVSGLAEGDRVLAAWTFFVAAERELRESRTDVIP